MCNELSKRRVINPQLWEAFEIEIAECVVPKNLQTIQQRILLPLLDKHHFNFTKRLILKRLLEETDNVEVFTDFQLDIVPFLHEEVLSPIFEACLVVLEVIVDQILDLVAQGLCCALLGGFHLALGTEDLFDMLGHSDRVELRIVVLRFVWSYGFFELFGVNEWRAVIRIHQYNMIDYPKIEQFVLLGFTNNTHLLIYQ